VAGNTATASLGGLSVDKTPPTVVYTGNAGVYRVDQTVTITCTAADALSGIASSTCASITGPAWSFGTGVVSRSASATDRADNVRTGSTSFVVGVTGDSLCGLTVQFVEASAKYRGLSAAQQRAVRLLTEAVCQKITEILPRLTPRQHDALIDAYQAGVQALVSVGYLTQAQATTLKSLADRL
jgi:hypothetical protein